MAAAPYNELNGVSDQIYKRRIWAWTMYDWANSAFSTTIVAAVLPIYFSRVAGATLASPTVATAYWSYGLSISLILIGVLSPILGTVSDILRGKKRLLAIFAGIGIISTSLLLLVTTGDWILASILAILGRVGFSGANIFYDALLPHVAKPEDQDNVSARGYAMGYLGGGILLIVDIFLIKYLPGTWGPRLSFLSVAIWWAIFSIPILRHIPEPPAATTRLKMGDNVIQSSFLRLIATFKDLRQYRELFKFLLAYLFYIDGIGTVIGMAAIYGTELGFGTIELAVALPVIQFVAIPYSLIFGRLPSDRDSRRPVYLAFILMNLVALPVLGFWGAASLPPAIIGTVNDAGVRQTNLLLIIGLIMVVQLVCLSLAFLLGKPLFSGLARILNTKRTILLALLFYIVVAFWGYRLNSVIEFWCIAWMIAMVQGGSQALSRSLYSAMSPAGKSGEFFGFFSIMEKFSGIMGPIMFIAAAAYFGSSRPAVLSLAALFIIGGLLLTRVNVEEGKRAANEENAALMAAQAISYQGE